MAKLSETARKNKVDYNLKYNQLMIKRICIALNKNTNSDIIDWLEKQPNKQRYILDLIEEDMKRQ